MAELTLHPKLDMLWLLKLGCDGPVRQSGHFGTEATVRLTTTLTVPGMTSPAVTGAPGLTRSP